MGLIGLSNYYYQLVGKMKNYAIGIVASKLIFLFSMIVLSFSKKITAIYMMCADFLSTIIILVSIIAVENEVFIKGTKTN